MEGRKKKGSSSSSSYSLTTDLFGSRENPSSSPSPSPSSGVFGSIFAPPSKVLGRATVRQETLTTGWNDKSSETGDVDGNREQQENLGSSVYQNQGIQQPCHLSSSIYYGGPDVYFQPHNSTINSTKKKDGGEDDSGSASRGNWWQGSLYY